MRQIVLGTAGHIDHGKTTLIRALTGVDTDRLAEEKERGITIDLGFAELEGGGDVRIGVVDVPGHEGFIRNMLAGATGMDVVLLVVAADEGVMPQTREHLAILDFLRVDRLVVAVTKADLVEPDWLELVVDDLGDFLESTRFAGSPILPVSAVNGTGLDDLRAMVIEAGGQLHGAGEDDVVVLPVDRVFTVRGTGTVVTGTLWSGRIAVGERVRLLPGGLDARVRGVQQHGTESEVATAGARVALALTGDGVDTTSVVRGQTVVAIPEWEESWMLTARVRVLPDTGWRLEDGQRVRVHLGTAEVMARCRVLEGDALDPGERGWVQLRLESPVSARAGDHLVLRSYSPVTTIAGGRIAEPHPPKRSTLDPVTRDRLETLLDTPEPSDRITAALELAGESGIGAALLPVRTGLSPSEVGDPAARGLSVESDGVHVAAAVAERLSDRILAAIDRVHEEEAFRPGVGREVVRAVATPATPRGLVDRVAELRVADGTLETGDGLLRRSGFTPTLTDAQTALRARLLEIFDEGGLAPPLLDEIDVELRDDPAFVPILRALEAEGRLVQVDDGFMADAEAVRGGVEAVRRGMAGREGVGPADFREAFPVSRKHLMPLLGYLDRIGVTRREGEGRTVVADRAP